MLIYFQYFRHLSGISKLKAHLKFYNIKNIVLVFHCFFLITIMVANLVSLIELQLHCHDWILRAGVPSASSRSWSCLCPHSHRSGNCGVELWRRPLRDSKIFCTPKFSTPTISQIRVHVWYVLGKRRPPGQHVSQYMCMLYCIMWCRSMRVRVVRITRTRNRNF